MNADARWMRRAIALAASRVGRTGDNPAVGCVLVKDDAVVGEAATAEGGRPHAEEQALAAAGPAAAGATAYVTLEPCAVRSHGGPSCADLLIGARVARVVYAVGDPHPNASRAGPARLAAAGIAAEQGLLAAEAKTLVAAFLARHSGG